MRLSSGAVLVAQDTDLFPLLKRLEKSLQFSAVRANAFAIGRRGSTQD
jgi:hypothetical protein